MPSHSLQKLQSGRLAFWGLLLLRGVPLFLRPAVIISEGRFLPNAFLLVEVIPFASLILMLSALPIHVDYFSHRQRPDPQSGIARGYASALTVVMLTGAIVLGIAMEAMTSASFKMTLCAIVYYLAEKYFDELSRWFEFQKHFGVWFVLQFTRSAWLFIPVGLAVAGLNYQGAFLWVAVAVLLLSKRLFSLVFGVGPCISWDALGPIKAKWLYVFGSSLPAIYRQAPRLLVVSWFPNIAHLYVSTAQVVQAASLMFDVRVLIPYRKISVRRPQLFNKLWLPFLRKIMICSGMTSAIYLVIALFWSWKGISYFDLGALFVPIFTAESLVLSALTFNAGLLPWFVARRKAAVTYGVCLAIYLCVIAACVTAKVQLWGVEAVFLLPALNVFMGIVWRWVVTARHFGYEF